MNYKNEIRHLLLLCASLFITAFVTSTALAAQFLGGPSVRVNPGTSVEFKWITDVAWFGKVEIFSTADGSGTPLLTKRSEDIAATAIKATQQVISVDVGPVLADNTTYYVKVTATDPTGATADLISPAPLPPFFTGAQAVSNIQADLITTTSVTISWQANVIGYGNIAFGTTSLDQSVQDFNNTTDHSIQVTGLSPGTTYQFRVSNLHAIDGDALASTTVQFTTARATSGGPGSHRTTDVVSVGYKPGAGQLEVDVSVPNSVDATARKAGKDFALCVTVSYTSANQTFETLKSGRMSIASLVGSGPGPNQQFLKGKSLELVEIPFGSTPPPGGSPGYAAVALILDPSEPTCP
jgi:hypothetical protein